MRGGINYGARQHFVYYIYGADGRCLYIGCSSHPERRWRQHRTNHPGLAEMAAKFQKRGPYTRAVARRVELEAICDQTPLFNLKSIDYTPEKYAEISRLNDAARSRAKSRRRAS